MLSHDSWSDLAASYGSQSSGSSQVSGPMAGRHQEGAMPQMQPQPPPPEEPPGGHPQYSYSSSKTGQHLHTLPYDAASAQPHPELPAQDIQQPNDGDSNRLRLIQPPPPTADAHVSQQAGVPPPMMMQAPPTSVVSHIKSLSFYLIFY